MNTLSKPALVAWGRALICIAALTGAEADATVVHFPVGTYYDPIYSADDLVVNGNFNLDPLVDPDHPFLANPHVTGWTISPAGPFPGTRNSNAGVGADGRGLRLGDLNLIDVSQDLQTFAGQTYQLSFFLAVDDSDAGNLLRVFAGGRLLANLDNTAYPPNDEGWFSQYIYDFEATSAQTTLDFQYQSPRVDQHLSNVSVLAVPEPTTSALLVVGMAAMWGLKRGRSARIRPHDAA